MATIVVGIEDSPRGEDAVALAGAIARAAGAEVLAVCAYPFDRRPVAHYNAPMGAALREQAEATLDRLCEPISDLASVRRVAVADPAPARALLTAAARGAALIVVGSTHAGHEGRVSPGSTAWRLLQGAPCAVAVAPQGHRLRPQVAGGRVTVAFDGSRGAWAALAAAAALARAWGRSLRLVSVFAPEPPVSPWLHTPPGFLRLTADAESAARATVERAAGAVPGAEAAFLRGDPARELALESEVAELLVTGSRGYGPEPAVLLGDVSGRLVQTAACPVLIVPNGVAAPLGGLVAPRGHLRTRAAA